MQNCIGIIYGGKSGKNFGYLTDSRPEYMLPYGARYRIIDIALSNFANNEFSNVVLYGGKIMRSTLDHLGNGESYELNRRRNGLVIFPPTFENAGKEIFAYNETRDFYLRSSEEDLYFCDPMVIFREDFTESHKRFTEENLDILLFCKKMTNATGLFVGETRLNLDDDGNLMSIGTNQGIDDEFYMMTNIGYMKKTVFLELVHDSLKNSSSNELIDIIISNLDKLKVGVYMVDGYVEVIRNLTQFYNSNLKLLNFEFYKNVFFKNGLLLTKSKDEPSALYGESACVKNSLIANGVKINGKVENSIIFRGVEIEESAIVKNSVIFERSIIKKNAVVVNTISDKGVVIKENVTVVGNPNYPYELKKYAVLEDK
ncbi:glucose-1-phosphate adenylyltransferase subunit GlgD [uncultured Finegoldia sp.]|uniref:glucose-1-phosphate adenylyltransferase subunit GlgD n=1 Tax=uncultured Finegoldia sp. TaxID=328009 RepID=UPI002619F35E|nr:glucose-1-phosphate adenylyltransferase subunit GlgD [uncultured Finegoldia sp.]